MTGEKGVGGSGCSKIYRRDAALTYPLSSTLTLLSNPTPAWAQRFSHLAASSPPLLSVFSCAPCGEVPHPPAISFEQKSAKKTEQSRSGQNSNTPCWASEWCGLDNNCVKNRNFQATAPVTVRGRLEQYQGNVMPPKSKGKKIQMQPLWLHILQTDNLKRHLQRKQVKMKISPISDTSQINAN